MDVRLQDQILLKRCNDGDHEAQNQFAELSYINEVSRTVREVTVRLSFPLDPTEEANLVIVIIGKIYGMWRDLPDGIRPLRKRIREHTMVIVWEYVRKKLAVR